MINMTIKSKPYSEMRYDTWGDYYDIGNTKTCIDVIEQKNWLYEYLIAIHELVEYVLIKARNLSIDEIEAFDKSCDSDDPGDDPKAPYYHEHQVATIVEKIVCDKLGLKWHEYEKEIDPEYFSFEDNS